MKILATLLILTLSLTCKSHAKDDPSVDFDFATTYIEHQCDFDKILAKGLTFNKWFFEYDKFITRHALDSCRAIYDEMGKSLKVDEYWSSDDLTAILRVNLQELNQAFELDQGADFPMLRNNYLSWLSVPSLPLTEKDQTAQPVRIESIKPDLERYYFLSTPSGLPRAKPERFALTPKQNKYCTDKFQDAKDCDEVFDAFNKINRKLSVFQRLDTIQQYNAYVAINNAKWERFSDNSRFQTFIDVVFTSLVFHKSLSIHDDLVTPPPVQLFALRPSFVYEHLSGSPGGDRDEPALALEWVGFNAWDLKIPLGVSLTSIYADRANVKSIGHGLTFHVNNTFSFGVATRGSGDNSFYINLELMDWFGDKKNYFQTYKKSRSLFD